jgi:hypothetical protein
MKASYEQSQFKSMDDLCTEKVKKAQMKKAYEEIIEKFRQNQNELISQNELLKNHGGAAINILYSLGPVVTPELARNLSAIGTKLVQSSVVMKDLISFTKSLDVIYNSNYQPTSLFSSIATAPGDIPELIEKAIAEQQSIQPQL